MIRRRHIFFTAASLLFLSMSACLRPLDSDFVTEGPGLEDNEMLWIVRVPNGEIAAKEVEDIENEETFKSRQNVMFDQAVVKITEDILNGTLNAYADYGDDKPIANIRERLQQFGGSKLNYAPLTRAFELFSIVDVSLNTYVSNTKFLALIWEEPGSSQNGRTFAGVYIDSLPPNRYVVETSRDRSVSFREYLRLEWFHYEPVYIRTNTLEYTPKSRAEANYLRDMVNSGKWRQLAWEDGGLNISGKTRIKVQPEEVLKYAGSYVVSRLDGSSEQEIFFSAQKDHLLVDWEERFELGKVYPFNTYGFYSHNGDVYLFENENDITRLYIVANADTLYGQRVGK